MSGRTNTQRILDALPPPGTAVRPVELATRLGLDRKAVAARLAKFLRFGFVTREKGRYQLTPAGLEARTSGWVLKFGPKGPHSRRRQVAAPIQERLWKALRQDGKATVSDLCQLADAGTAAVHQFLGRLQKAGYVTKLARRVPGTRPSSNGFAQYLLLPEKNTGPRVPRWSSKWRELFDPNIDKIVYREGGE